MKIELIEYIRLFSNLSVVIPLLVYLSLLRKVPIQHHFVGTLIFTGALTDSLSFFHLYHSPMLSNAYSIIQFGLLSCFYYELVYKKRATLTMYITTGIYLSTLLFAIVMYNFKENFTTVWALGSLIISIHALVYIFNITTIVLDRYFDIHLLSNVILNATFFGYATITLFIFLFTNLVFSNHDPETINAFWSFHNSINILKNIGIAIGLYYTGKREIYMSLEQLDKIARKLKEQENLDQ